MKTIIALLMLVAQISMANTIQVSTGSLDIVEQFSSNYVSPRSVHIWLPDGYSRNKKYAVLYMHDGQMLYDPDFAWNKQSWNVDETVGRLIKEKKIRDVIVVGIFNTSARHSEYFPQKPMESLDDEYQKQLYEIAFEKDKHLFSEKVKSDNYLKFVVKELKPYIDNKYSVLVGKEDTFIMGSSMGGLVSMYALSEYPDVFGGAGCLSTHWPGILRDEHNRIPQAFIRYMRANLPKANSRKIYFDYGNKTLDAMYPPLQKKVDEMMIELGWRSEYWVTHFFDGADHTENAWRDRLHIPLEFLLGVH